MPPTPVLLDPNDRGYALARQILDTLQNEFADQHDLAVAMRTAMHVLSAHYLTHFKR